MQYIVKFFPEITIKSKPVRKQMTKRLQNNLANLMRSVSEHIKVKLDWDQIIIDVQDERDEVELQVSEVLANTPGIAYFLQVKSSTFVDLDDVCQQVHTQFAESLAGKTFLLRCKRAGEHSFSSHDAERYVGGFLNQNSEALGVKMKGADITVNIEIRHERLFMVHKRVEGLGGFPLGEVEPVLSLISGGFDSPVASFLTIKRGMPTHFCFFNLGGRDHELGVKEVAYYLWQKYSASRRVKFVSVPFEPVVAEILQNIDNSQMGVVLKRMMLRAAEKVAEQLEVPVLVTGEAVAQVSSQTLTNLNVIDKATDMLVLRPLITADKNDIINIARKIGTEEFAANMPEYCGVISVKPTTRAKMHKIEKEEARFDFSILDQAVSDANYINIDQLADEDFTPVAVESFAVPLPNASIIDIRHPDEQERKPLVVAGQDILAIPFYALHKQIAELPKDKKYLLYCDKGVMSRLHASHLVEDGLDVAVYRPQ
jgi:thiamine biosynthesis protein ThiI